MRVLITGGGGFIAAWIARRLLARGTTIRALDLEANPSLAHEIVGTEAHAIEWRTGDVSDGGVVLEAAADCELIIHLAAVLTPACQADPVRGAEINLIGTLNVFEAAQSHGHSRVLYMSSAGVFGPDDGETPRPTTHYGAFKLAGEGCARAYWADHGIASAGFRPLVVYGPGRTVGLTAGPTLACRAAARGEAYDIPFSGESDFVFVDDVAAAFEAAMDASLEGAHAYNLCGELASVQRVADAIAGLVLEASIGVTGPALPVAARIDDSALRAAFPDVPRTSLADGIGRTIEHYRARPDDDPATRQP